MTAARPLRMAMALVVLASLNAAAAAAPADHSSLFRAKRIGDRALAAQSGGTDAGGAASLQGSVSNNQALNVATGGNQIAGGALAGAAGVPVVIQNTGNNVLIQSATIVNVQLK